MTRAVAALTSLLVLSSTVATAQDGVRLDRLRPPPSSSDGLGMPLARTVGHLVPSFGLVIDYAFQPLVARGPASGEFGAIVSHRVGAHVLGALGITDRLELHLRVPVIFQVGDAPTVAGVSFGAPDPVTLADPAFGGSVRILGEDADVFHLGALVELFFPFTAASGWSSDQELSFRGEVLFDVSIPGIVIEVMAGASYRPERQLITMRTASELDVAIGAKVPVFADTDIFAELHLASGLRDDLFFQTPGTALELLLGGRYRHRETGLAAELGIGIGFLHAPGTPSFRGFAAIRWEPPPPPPPNADGDAFLDADDGCPTEAEDADGHRDEDGCPDPDDDGDGLLDGDDPCPREVEDEDGFMDGDGCPDLDDDEDEFPDEEDRCPRAPGPSSSRGCPVTLQIEGTEIRLLRDIDFVAGEATLVPTDGVILDELAAVMRLEPTGARWRIEVRPSRASRRDDGAALAAERAAAVVSSLVLRDVPAERLESSAAPTDAEDFIRVRTIEP